ncbi:MAG: hypothetical protein B6I38_08370 [Anaerolineaceae bacterium 4572_5.1]|nr:MAG: hypothetical protein B6I38_08370 [Anaerolineaceae bacterium 4572_5.1]
MLTKIRQILAPPIFKDPEKNHRANFLNTILLTFIAANCVMAIPIFFTTNPIPGLLTDGIAISLWMTFRYILKRGHIQLASNLTVGGAWVLQTSLLFLLDGLHRPIFAIYFLIIIITIVLRGRNAGYILTGITTIVVIAVHIAYVQELLPPPIIPTSLLSGLIQNIAFMFTIAAAMALAMRNLNEAIKQSYQSEQAQQEAIQNLQEMQATLQQRVIERTETLQQQASQIQAAAEVGQAAATIRDIEILLPQVTRLISERFDFYHIGIFMLDENNEYAVLKAANSEGGKQMLERGHRLKVGEVGIVGYVTSQQKARIALDVGEDATFFDNPYLPETRSEMALPLIAGGRLLGALDVQSKREAAFSNEDITVLQVLADQVAIAIENARLFAERQEALESAQRAFGELSQEAWSELLRDQSDLGFLSTFTQNVQPAEGEWTPGMVEAAKLGKITKITPQAIAIPIILRGQTLGVVRLVKSEDAAPWNEDEIELMDTLIDQLEVALESARLFRETQQRAKRERLVSDITTKIRSTTDPEQMLKTAVEELKQALNTAQAHFVIPQAEGETND